MVTNFSYEADFGQRTTKVKWGPVSSQNLSSLSQSVVSDRNAGRRRARGRASQVTPYFCSSASRIVAESASIRAWSWPR